MFSVSFGSFSFYPWSLTLDSTSASAYSFMWTSFSTGRSFLFSSLSLVLLEVSYESSFFSYG